MWRLLPILAVLGCLEVLVPWSDVAALVLSNAPPADPRVITLHMTTAAPVEMRHDPSQLLVQARAVSR
jgi:hypothetical protein